jgi:hypothetical protein
MNISSVVSSGFVFGSAINIKVVNYDVGGFAYVLFQIVCLILGGVALQFFLEEKMKFKNGTQWTLRKLVKSFQKIMIKES